MTLNCWMCGMIISNKCYLRSVQLTSDRISIRSKIYTRLLRGTKELMGIDTAELAREGLQLSKKGEGADHMIVQIGKHPSARGKRVRRITCHFSEFKFSRELWKLDFPISEIFAKLFRHRSFLPSKTYKAVFQWSCIVHVDVYGHIHLGTSNPLCLSVFQNRRNPFQVENTEHK